MRNAAKKLFAVLAATALIAGTVGVAEAKGPPLGKYKCYQFDPVSGYLYQGGFRLKHHHKYSVLGSGKGKFKTKGKKVIFKSGPYHKYHWFGKFRHDDKGNPVIDIHDKTDPNLVLNCSKT